MKICTTLVYFLQFANNPPSEGKHKATILLYKHLPQMEITPEQKDWWVVDVESSLIGETRADESCDGLIDKVPKPLLTSETEVLYHPQIISFGPYHFTKKRKSDDEMELLKSEVVRYVHHKVVTRENGLISVMESFKENEEKVKKSYAREFEVTGEVCAWMITRDACFVLQVLKSFLDGDGDGDGDGDKDGDKDKKKRITASIDGILSRKRHHPLLAEIVKDMFKMENQLPFWALQEIKSNCDKWFEKALKSNCDKWFEKALKNLSPIEVADVGNNRNYEGYYHILQMLHDYIVDSQQSSASSDHQSGSSLGEVLKTALDAIRRIIFHPGSLYRPCWCSLDCFEDCEECCFDYCDGRFRGRFGRCLLWWSYLESCLVWCILLVPVMVYPVLSAVLFILFIIFVIANTRPAKWNIRKHLPTAEELKGLGVNFKKLEGEKLGISHIEFKERYSTLYLPQFNVDNRSEVMLRNLIALEICSQKVEKPITRYAILMNDLINTSEDVGILRGEDIITSKLGSDEETARFWNSMVTATELPSYNPIDKVVLSIENYRNMWWKVLWAQYVMSHCSKPWLVVSLLAGFILLLLTFTQVICLFLSCQIKK